MKIKLPKRFYTIEQLAERWECKVADIKHLEEIEELRSIEKIAAIDGYKELRFLTVKEIPGAPLTEVIRIEHEAMAKEKDELERHYKNIIRDVYNTTIEEFMSTICCYVVHDPDNVDDDGLTELDRLRNSGQFELVYLAEEVSRFEQQHGKPDDETTPARVTSEDIAPPSTWPWGDYETPLLRILAEAVNHFCLDGPVRYPKKECGAVVDWIKARMQANGMPPSDQLAGAMETLIAPRPYAHHRQRKQGKP